MAKSMPSSALLACFVWLFVWRFNCHAYTNKLRGTIALVANAATNCALIARVPFDRPASLHFAIVKWPQLTKRNLLFVFSVFIFVHRLYIYFFFSTPFLRSYLISTPPSFVPRIVMNLCTAVLLTSVIVTILCIVSDSALFLCPCTFFF